MVRVTNNTRDFFEKDEEVLIALYGAGNAGYWVGYYMNLCAREFAFYIDKEITHEDATYNGKPIFPPKKLKDYAGKQIKIVVTPKAYQEILFQLLWMDYQYGMDILCLVPVYKSIVTHEDEYAINKLLAYFRRQLFQGETPTIICNTCAAGTIYEMMGLFWLTPTINVGIAAEDYFRICGNLNYYMGIEMKAAGRRRRMVNNAPIVEDDITGKIGDCEIVFSHTSHEEEAIARWNILRNKINWDRIIYLYIDQKHEVVSPYFVKEKFNELSEPKLYVSQLGMRNMGGADSFYMQDNFFARMDIAIENHFDLLGWLNECNKKF